MKEGLLETELRRIEELGRDLSAEIVISPEKGNYESQIVASTGLDYDPKTWILYGDGPQEEEVWVVKQPEKRGPNREKIEVAKTQLQQICDSSEWHSARYCAGKALNLSSKKLNRIIALGLKNLRSQLKANRESVEQIAVGSHYEDYCPPFQYPSDGCMALDAREVIDYEERTGEIPDFNKRLKASNDVEVLYRVADNRKVRKRCGKLLDLSGVEILGDEVLRGTKLSENKLKKVYNKRSLDIEAKVKAGKDLGYSDLRIWTHKHPIISKGILAAVGIATGLYVLSQFLEK